MWRFLFLLISLFLVGCGSNSLAIVTVEGRVTLNGQPVDKAVVSLIPTSGQNLPASGVTDSQGKFTLKTVEGAREHAGAIPGDFDIIVIKTIGPKVMADADGLSGEVDPNSPKETQYLVPQKYARPETSTLKCKVEKGMKPLDLALQP
jgi:hypothetical protein